MRPTTHHFLAATTVLSLLSGPAWGQAVRRPGQWLQVPPEDAAGQARAAGAARAPAETQAIAVRRMSTAATSVAFEVTMARAWLAPAVSHQGKDYSSLSIPGCGNDGEAVGRPDLPFKGFLVEVPFGGAVALEITAAETVSLGAGYRILPEQVPEPDDGSEPAEFAVDNATYAKAEFLPVEPVTISDPKVIRGRRVVFVQVFPIQYNPQTGELRAFRTISFKLIHEGRPTAEEMSRKRRLATPVSEAKAKRLIANYEPLPEGGPDPDGDPPAGGGDGEGAAGGEPDGPGDDGADYLIIVADDLVDAIQPLASWKYKKGLATRVLTMSEVGSTSADIKAVIQNAYDTWSPAPAYVLLVGDEDDVPPDYFGGALDCHTDQLYACVDGDDYFPDLTIGRVPAQSSGVCSTVVSKILAYERTPEPGDWYSAFLTAGYFQDENRNGEADRWFMETSAYASEFLMNTVGLTRYTAWCKDMSDQHDVYHYRSMDYPHRFDYPDPVPVSVTSLWRDYMGAAGEITTAIHAGVGFILHRDHGSETSWGAPPFFVGDVQALSNGSKTPILLSINCKTGSFQRSSSDCFCEAFLKHDAGGAVGAIGSTRNSYSGYNDLISHGLMTCFWPGYDPTHTDQTYPVTWELAPALTYAKYYMYVYKGPGDYSEGEFHMFHWFGDPEMELRTQSPQPLTVDHTVVVDAQVPETASVTVTQGGSPLEGALVCIAHEPAQDQWSGLTDSNGNVTFTDIVFREKADYSVVVTAVNALPYEGILTAGPAPMGQIALDRDAYSDDGTVTIEVSDRDVRGSGQQIAGIVTSGGDSEQVVLYESEPDSAVFIGTIQTTPLPVAAEDGALQVAEGHTVTASYYDEDDGTGQPATVEDSAVVDTTPPVITTVEMVSVNGIKAVVRVETDTPTTVKVSCGAGCGGPYPHTSESSELATEHLVTVTGLQGETPYVYIAEVWDHALNHVVADNDGACYAFETPFRPEYWTQQFTGNASDLSYRSITFTPDGSPSFYQACSQTVDDFFTSPSGSLILPLGDNTTWLIPLRDGQRALFYGDEVYAFHVGSNGYLSGTGQIGSPIGTYEAHFSQSQFSALFTDLDPSAGGTVSFKQLADRAAVTWLNVPERATGNLNSFQIEMFFDGRIRLTYLDITADSAVVGLSTGQGIPDDFLPSDLLACIPCGQQYVLDVSVLRNDAAEVTFEPEPNDPNQPSYDPGTIVTLTVLSEDPDRRFRYWEIFDPNHPDDANYVSQDANETISLVMDSDLTVRAIYACGTEDMIFVYLGPTLLLVLHAHRRRRRNR